ncbi:MAG TPA: tetratricopeptide repeat protein, partial [Blastocatellia bacterium]
MRRAFVIFASLSFIVSGLLQRQQPARAQTSDESQVRIVVDKFFAALQKKDLGAIMSLWCQDPAGRQDITKSLHETFAKIGVVEMPSPPQVRKIEVSGVKASVRIYVELAATDAAGKPVDGFGKINRLLQLTKESGAWMICRYASAEEDLAARIAIVKTEQDRKAMLDANKDLMTVELEKDILSAASALPLQTDYQQVFDLLSLAEGLAGELKDQAGLANILRAKGDLQKNHGLNDKALESYQRSASIFEGIGDEKGLAAAINGVAVIYTLLGNYPVALEKYHRSLDIARQIGDKARVARLLDNIGYVQHAQADFTAAMGSYRESLRVAEETGDTRTMTDAMVNIAVQLTDQGDFFEALTLLKRSLALAQEAGWLDRVDKILFDLARIKTTQADYPQAAEYFSRAREISERIDDKQAIAYCFLGLGVLQLEQENYDKADELLQQSLRMGDGLGDKIATGAALNNVGRSMSEQGKYSEALISLERALRLATEIGDKAQAAATLCKIGDANSALRRYPSAFEAYEQSARLSEQIGFPGALASALEGEAAAYRTQGQTGQAEALLTKAISILEELSSHFGGGAPQREHFSERSVEPCHLMAEVLLSRGNEARALSFAEESKARTLVDVLQNGKMDLSRGMTAGETARERQLDTALASLNEFLLHERMRDHPDPKRMERLESALQKARVDRELFETELYAAHPEVRVQRGKFEPISAEKCSDLVPDTHTALLEFLVSDDDTEIFVITKRSAADSVPTLRTHKIDVSLKDLTKLVGQFHDGMVRRDLTLGGLSTKLYDLLIRPLSGDLSGKTNLIIVPDLALWELPFQALQPARNHFFIEDHAISYAPSLSALREMQKLKH